MTNRLRAMLLAATLGTGCLAALPAAAQSQPTPTVCMAVAPATQPPGPEMVIAVAPTRQSALEEKGFHVRPCGEGHSLAVQVQARVCGVASRTDAALQERFAQRWRLTSRELCDLATEAAGG